VALVAMENVGEVGIVKDYSSWQLPQNAWSDGNNVRAWQGSIEKIKGYAEVMASCPVAPYHITFVQSGSDKYFIAGGLAKIYVHDGSSWTNITRQTTGSDVDYSATAAGGWTSTLIGGVLVMTNGVDDPQFWALSSGVPSTATKMDDLSNWPGSTECKSLRAFRSFLIALNVTESSVNYPRLVKWSTEAATQTVPSSWDDTLATNDAGEIELSMATAPIVEGLPLRDTFMIYTEQETFSMTFVGTPFIFSFRMLSPSVGAMAKNCIAEFDGGHFIFGRSDFYLNSGDRITPLLPTKMRDYVFGFMDGEQTEKSFVVADAGRTEIWACFVSANSANDQVDKAVIWNYANNTFTIRDLPELAHIGVGVIDNPNSFAAWSAASVSWASAEGHWAQTYDKYQDVLVFASPTNTKLYRDRSGNTEDGTNMTSYIERTGLSLTAQGTPDQTTVKRIKAIWPKMTVENEDTVDFYVSSQMSTEEAISWKGPFSFNPDSQSKVSCRSAGKLYGIKIESTGDTSWRLTGLEFELEDAGRRGSRAY